MFISYLKVEAIFFVDLFLIKEVILRVIRFEIECVLFVILCIDFYVVILVIIFEIVFFSGVV